MSPDRLSRTSVDDKPAVSEADFSFYDFVLKAGHVDFGHQAKDTVEVFGRSPRARTECASPVFELLSGDDLTLLVQDLKARPAVAGSR
jgi:hypothetical protein